MGVGSCVECGDGMCLVGWNAAGAAGRRRRLEWGRKHIMEVVLCDVEINVKIVPTLHDFSACIFITKCLLSFPGLERLCEPFHLAHVRG
ncbi:hypothetical protein NDU88_003785 [Pleurodeles waltl]|uniref:Uncharacterized protein n=1 Tax=Pleurodeles waltl TaxID=8319 RepID=A0AAV7W350_PLEWA|nr:hypothetical protein NDU88_003785 [Pleurodeles waltl]